MTKYRLKDQDLQKALEKAAPGFSKALDEGFGTTGSKHHTLISVIPTENDGSNFLEMNIPKSLVEKIKEYDPGKWNLYPEVTPPEHELMRVEMINVFGAMCHFCAYFYRGRWFDADTDSVRSDRVERFRPWDDAPEP